jgi:molybdopterin converting factor small subunit
MAHVTLYGTFRRHVDNWRCEVDAPTVGDALRALTADNLALAEAIFDDGGTPGAECTALRQYVRVVVNGRDIALGDCLETPLGAADAVAVFSPIAGGD